MKQGPVLKLASGFLLLWCLLWPVAGWAQDVSPPLDRTIIFRTYPSGAEVDELQPDRFLGFTGQPLTIQIPADRDVTLQFSFTLDGYDKGHMEVSTAQLRDHPVTTLPASGELPLHSASLLMSLKDHPLAVAGVVVVLLVGWGVGQVLSRMRRPPQAQAPPPASPAMTETDGQGVARIGQRLGNWVLADRIGKGGMAVVYRAVPADSMDESRSVAIKVIRPEVLHSPEVRVRFDREIRIGSRLDHPHIVKVIDWDASGPCYLVMQLVQGATLRTRVVNEGMPPAEAMRLMRPVFEAMIYAHEQGVWHRDLKPENILVGKGDWMTIMDFGISRQVTDETVTAADRMPATPGYMSPEQLSGKGVMAPSDQYSLGIMMWELMVGHRPFRGDATSVVLSHAQTPLPPMRRFRPALAESLDWVIERMCAKEAVERYPDLRSALQALESAVES